MKKLLIVLLSLMSVIGYGQSMADSLNGVVYVGVNANDAKGWSWRRSMMHINAQFKNDSLQWRQDIADSIAGIENTLSFRVTSGNDSISFPALKYRFGFGVSYTVVCDSLSGVGATLTIKQRNTSVGVYDNVNETVLPWTIATGTQYFYCSAIQQYQKVLINIGSATKVKLTVIRRVKFQNN
jgi:hypothetical protein